MPQLNLRSRLIRLASANGDLRPHLLPLLREAMEFPTEEARKKYLKEHPGADPKNHTVKQKGNGKAQVGDQDVRDMTEDYKEEARNRKPSGDHVDDAVQAALNPKKRKAIEQKIIRGIKTPADAYVMAKAFSQAKGWNLKGDELDYADEMVAKLNAHADKMIRKSLAG